MNRLLSSVMRGVGRKRRRDDPHRQRIDGAGDSSDDDSELDPDFAPQSDESCHAESSQNRSIVKRMKTAIAKTSRIKSTSNGSKSNGSHGARKGRETSKSKKIVSSSAANDSEKPSSISLDNLPTDVLIRIVELAASHTGILSLAGTMSQVCRRFRHFFSVESSSYSSALWSCADLSRLGRRITVAQLHSVALPRFPSLRALNLEGWLALRDKDIEAICQTYGDTLSEISLAGSDHLSGRSVTALTERCRRLTRLSLRRLPHRLAHGQLLGQLIQRHSGTLCDLTIDSLQGEIVGFGVLMNSLASGAALPALRHLRLANLRASSRRDAALNVSSLSESAPNLLELELVNLPLIDDLNFVWPHCRLAQLRHLLVQELANPSRLTVSSAALPRLTSLCVIAADFDLVDDFALRIDDVTDDVTESRSGFRGLQRLVVAHCTNADEASTLAPLLSMAEAGQLTDLEEVDFTGSPVVGAPESSGRLMAALAALPQLRRLNLTGTAARLRDVRLIASSSQSLFELNLTSCKSLPRGFKQLLPSRSSIEAWLARDEPIGDTD